MGGRSYDFGGEVSLAVAENSHSASEQPVIFGLHVWDSAKAICRLLEQDKVGLPLAGAMVAERDSADVKARGCGIGAR